MKKKYDFVYLTNTPSFYKFNLCNEISKTHSVLLVLYGYGSEAVNTILGDSVETRFDYTFINQGDSNDRNKLKTFLGLIKLMRRIKCRKILYSGWMAPEYNLFSLFSAKKRNVLVCESTIFDTNFSGLKGLIKRLVISRMNAVLPSGKPHTELFKRIGFKGKCNITGSVGIFNKGARDIDLTKPRVHSDLKYLYVGRLIDVKNVGLLIDAFNLNGKPLTIVGDGVLANALKSKANSNIEFMGFVNNDSLGEVYQTHDVFILPSYSETWGLVVEEALYWGLPVIVSDRVGSSIDMVKDLGTGLIFKSGDKNDLQACIDKMENEYDNFLENVKAIDWIEKDKRQVEAYLDLIEG